MSISAILLADGEAENLKVLFPQIISKLQSITETFEIILIDSAVAKDDTAQVCSLYPQVRYINQKEPRYAGAFRTGIRYARYDFALVMDTDGSHSPLVIDQLYHKILEGYDIVIGSRYCKDGSSHDAFSSYLMSRLLNFIMRLVIGIKVKDMSISFRIYRTEELKAVPLTSENFEVLQEVMLRMKKNKKSFTIAEVPITSEKRMYGQSKRKLVRFIFTYVKTLFTFLKIRMTNK